MLRFIDTIKLADGHYELIGSHNKRINDTINHFFGFNPSIDLNSSLPKPGKYKPGIYKCRLTYSDRIENIEITPYIKRTIKGLKVIDLDSPVFPSEYKTFNYEFKYQDRTLINSFLTGIDALSDILFIKNGLLTDTSFSNIILFDGEKWITPDAYLLNGVKRRHLLENGEIIEKKVSTYDLSRFQKISLINAMLEPEDITIDICDVVF
jgi:4-amino-4-deoxychorismate lyase